MKVSEYVIDIPVEFKQGKREQNGANAYGSAFKEIADWRSIIGEGDLYEGDCIHCAEDMRLCSYIALLREDKLVFSPINEYKLPPYFTNLAWPLSYWENTSIQYFHVNFAGSIIEEYNPTSKMFRIALRTGEEITLFSHSCGPFPRHFLQALTADHAEPFLTHITNDEGQLLGSLHQFPSTPWGYAIKALMYADLNMKREGELALDILPYSMLAAMGSPTFPNPNTNRLITNAIQQMAAIKEELTPWIHRGPGSVVGQYL